MLISALFCLEKLQTNLALAFVQTVAFDNVSFQSLIARKHLLTLTALQFVRFNNIILRDSISPTDRRFVVFRREEGLGDGLEALEHLLDVAGEELPSAYAGESLVEALDEGALHLEGVVYVLDQVHHGAVVVAEVDAPSAGLAGAAELVSFCADELGGLD